MRCYYDDVCCVLSMKGYSSEQDNKIEAQLIADGRWTARRQLKSSPLYTVCTAVRKITFGKACDLVNDLEGHSRSSELSVLR